MTKDTLRKATCLVIQKDGEYLSRIGSMVGLMVWDVHLSNAWTTRNKEKAMCKADEFGGTLMLFNPIIWRVERL